MNPFDLPASDPAALRIREAAGRGTLSHALLLTGGAALAAAIIETVKYKVEHLTGVAVGRVNVCVEDIRV